VIKWLYDHYFITTLIALYYMILSGYGTYQVFSQITQITGSGVAAYGTLMALPPAAVAMIRWRIGKDNE
jgi:hypothetical protein